MIEGHIVKMTFVSCISLLQVLLACPFSLMCAQFHMICWIYFLVWRLIEKLLIHWLTKIDVLVLNFVKPKCKWKLLWDLWWCMLLCCLVSWPTMFIVLTRWYLLLEGRPWYKVALLRPEDQGSNLGNNSMFKALYIGPLWISHWLKLCMLGLSFFLLHSSIWMFLS